MNTPKHIQKTAILVLLLSIAVFSYTLYSQNQQGKAEKKLKQEGDTATKVDTQSEEEPKTLDTCGKIDSSLALYSNSTTSLSFCYKTSWGVPTVKETEISPESKIGTKYYISFIKLVNGKLVYDSPSISYSTLDFQLTGDRDGSPLMMGKWDTLNFSASETELAKLFVNQNAVVQKLTTSNSVQAFKVKLDYIEPLSEERITPVHYLIPNIIINETKYNLHIVGSLEQEADLDKLLESMTF